MSATAAAYRLRDRSVLVTGATGKVGRRLVRVLLGARARVSVLTRDPVGARTLWPEAPLDLRSGDLTDPATLDGLLEGIDTVLHLASYSPRPDEPEIYEAPAHWPVTALGTRRLAALVPGSQVARIVYVSSVKAMGDAAGARGRPADERDEPRPDTLYGRAKLDAEQCVLALGRSAGVHAAVLRLPMVYGLEGAGNLARMIDAVARGRFPPWPHIENRRSAVHVDDALRATLLLADNPMAGGEVYLITDGRPYSTRWLYESIRDALGRPAPAWTVPYWLLAAAAGAGSLMERLSGRAMPLTRVGLQKLTGDAWYSSEKIARELGFVPEHSLATEIPRLVDAYLHSGSAQVGGSAELARLLALGVGRPVCMFPISSALLLLAARIAGRTDLIERLFGSSQVNTAKVTRLLNWRPLIPLEER